MSEAVTNLSSAKCLLFFFFLYSSPELTVILSAKKIILEVILDIFIYIHTYYNKKFRKVRN